MNGKRNRTTRGILAVSVLSMALSVCMCVGTTFAWFEATVKNENVIAIGEFTTNATITSTQARSATRVSGTAQVFLPGSYDLTVRGVGNTPGYALIFLDATTSDFRSDAYYTKQLRGGSVCTYRIVLHEPTAIRVTPVWGNMEGENPLKEDTIIWYGRPPVVNKTEDDEAKQTGEENTTPTVDQTNNTTSTNGEGGSTENTQNTESVTNTTPSGDAESNATGGAENTQDTGSVINMTPSGSAESNTTGAAENTQDTGSVTNTTPSGSAESNTTGAAGDTQDTGSVMNTTNTGDPGSASEEVSA